MLFPRFVVGRFTSRTLYLLVQNSLFQTSAVQTQNAIIVGRRRKEHKNPKKDNHAGRLKKKKIPRVFCF